MNGCPPTAHVHAVQGLLDFRGYAVFDVTITLCLLTDNEMLAQRVAALINAYGLVDIPADASSLTTPWPPPNGPRVVAQLYRLPHNPKENRP